MQVEQFTGRFIRGTGDIEYLRLLDTAQRMFTEDPEVPNISMMYTPEWNGLSLGASWDAWWIQNTYGASFCILPFLQEPYLTFMANSNNLWFSWIGDDKTADYHGAIGPDGCLCDAARPDFTFYRQGDGEFWRHDFAMEMTGAGIVIQGELLLVTRDPQLLAHYLPLLERSAEFVESRRDPANDLFLVGFAGNLLGPSWTGTVYPDGRIDKGYLAGMSVTYIAALDRMIELEKLAGYTDKVQLYMDRRERARRGLKQLITEEGYFVKGIDLLGVKHGVYGAEQHGYFETNVNVDAVAHSVVDLAQAEKIVEKMASIPGLRPHGVTTANYPSLDDQLDYDYSFGSWVNGGHWSTSEARALLAYYRVGRYADIAASLRQIMKFFDDYLIDNPLKDFGNQLWFEDHITTVIYDGFGVPAGLLRGLLQPVYTADALMLIPSIPPGINALDGLVPLRFGTKRIEVSVKREANVKLSVTLNGTPWANFDGALITLPFDRIPDHAAVEITLPLVEGGYMAVAPNTVTSNALTVTQAQSTDDPFIDREKALTAAEAALRSLQTQPEFEAAFIHSARQAITAHRIRIARDAAGNYTQFTEEKRQAIIALYEQAADALLTGLDDHLHTLTHSNDLEKAILAAAYIKAVARLYVPSSAVFSA